MSESGYARILIVGGHDSSGGAGIDADHVSVRDLPIEPIVVATAFTIQDERGVQSIGAREPSEWMRTARELVKSMLNVERRGQRAESSEITDKHDRELGDASPHAVKFGLLPGAEHVRAAVGLIGELRSVNNELPIVVDPVITSSSGTRFLDRAALDVLRNELIAAHIVLTPNLAEAAELASMPLAKLVHEPESRIEAARKLLALGAAAVIVKAGHGEEDPARDLIAARGEPIRWVEHARIRGGKIRGSGCRFATRLAAHLALGRTLEAGAREAGEHVARQIRERSA
jgi:hydroxymethylpyrimidine/phosphomethylpyrimidine kinase